MSGINKTVEIYGQKITYGALTVAILGLIIGSLFLFNGIFTLGILSLLMYASASFTINCVVLGECNKWAVILVMANVLTAISSIAGAIGLSKGLKK